MRRRAVRAVLVVVALLVLANLLYAAKSLLGIDLDPGTHHGDWFPLGNWLFERFKPVDPVLSFAGPYRTFEVQGKRGEADGEIAAGWRDNSTWGPVKVHYEHVAGEAGAHPDAQRVNTARLGSGGSCQFVQVIAAEAEQTYVLTARLRAEQPIEVTAMLRQLKAPYRAFAATTVTLGSAWTTVTASGSAARFEVPDGKIQVSFRTSDLGSFDVEQADVALRSE